MWVKDWERRPMRNFPTSRYNKYKVKYFVDILWRDNKAEYAVIELPTNDIVKVFTFKEDLHGATASCAPPMAPATPPGALIQEHLEIGL